MFNSLSRGRQQEHSSSSKPKKKKTSLTKLCESHGNEIVVRLAMATQDPDLRDIPDPVATGQVPIAVLDSDQRAAPEGTQPRLLSPCTH
jgi:hypothetical protein